MTKKELLKKLESYPDETIISGMYSRNFILFDDIVVKKDKVAKWFMDDLAPDYKLSYHIIIGPSTFINRKK